METSEKGCAGVCPKCGQFMLEMKPDNPAFNDYVFELLKKASIAADRRVKEEEDLFEGYLITQADALSIRDYFDGMMGMAEMALIPEDFDSLKKKLTEARLKSSKDSLKRLFSYKQGEALRYIDFIREEMEIEEENNAKEFKRIEPDIRPKMAKVLSIIKELSREGDAMVSVSLNEIVRKCQAEGLNIGDILRSIEFLKRDGEIFEPAKDRIQLI